MVSTRGRTKFTMKLFTDLTWSKLRVGKVWNGTVHRANMVRTRGRTKCEMVLFTKLTCSEPGYC